VMGGIAMLAAGLTAFYMTRLMLMTFFGKERWKELRSEDGHEYHPHESPAVMTIPMVLLAVGSVAAGFLLQFNHAIMQWLAPSLGELEEGGQGAMSQSTVATGTLVLSALGLVIAYLVVGLRPVPVTRPEPVSFPIQAARRDLYANAINEVLIARPGIWLTRALVFLDNKGVDGIVNGVAALLGGTSGRMRRLQTGFVRSYAMSMLGGTVLIIAALLAVRFGTQ
ncbi:MAG: NADH-quinone oxidoreductase subunit L, partial [Pseudonocardia sp.]|nr:NADH-quinone oxidoreductase subunit L [Pseudonocardia sp.]